MEWLWGALAVAAVLAAVALVLWRPLRAVGREIQAERARELFVLQRERLEARFVTAASATGKPRGLSWKDVDFASEVFLARDRETRQFVALVSVAIRFEAVEGSDMEGHSEVDKLRSASALFFFCQGQWLTNGKALFNLDPGEVLAHFQGQYERVEV